MNLSDIRLPYDDDKPPEKGRRGKHLNDETLPEQDEPESDSGETTAGETEQRPKAKVKRT